MDTLLSVVRHGAQFLAGYLVSKGIIDTSMTDVIIGLATGLATLGWFFYSKKKAA